MINCTGTIGVGEKMDRLKEIEDVLRIGYVRSSKDITCLVVGREEKNGLRIVNTFYGEEAEHIYERLLGIRIGSNNEEEAIPNFVYKGVLYPDKEEMFKRVEAALGFKLFTWQKSFIETGIFRRYGETTARCLRDLLAVDSPPLDFSKKPTHPRSEFYKKEIKEIQQKLNEAGIQTRKVFWNESDKRKYYSIT